MTSDPASFARKTIVERKAQIIARVIADHDYPGETVDRLAAFRDEILHPDHGSSAILALSETGGEAAFWNAALAAYEGHSWLEVPWYFAETYFYRRLLEATGYFVPPTGGQDPFAPQKRTQGASAVKQLCAFWPGIPATASDARFLTLLHACLWGNRADLSNFTIDQQAVGDTAADRANILIDHTDAVRRLLARGVNEVAFVNDNVGADCLFDLVLADYLLTQGWAQRVTFHLKNQPFFVSDAMPQDIELVVDLLQTAASVYRVASADAGASVAELGHRLGVALEEQRLTLTTHPFWTQCLGFRDMPDAVRSPLERADLVILKGDVNYRRLLDDRHWPPSTPLSVAGDDFPRPFLVLRTLKGEIIAGLEPGQAERLSAEDPTWLINGLRGLIHLEM
jgi:uncharacterized protein with ATP-grasp and redox domains